VEWYWQGKSELGKEKSFTVSFIHHKFHIGCKRFNLATSYLKSVTVYPNNYFLYCEMVEFLTVWAVR